MESRSASITRSPMERSMPNTKSRRGDRMVIPDDISIAPTLITASSPNKGHVKLRDAWPSPPSSTLPFLPLHPRTISFAKPLDGTYDYLPPLPTRGMPHTSRLSEPTNPDWLLQRLQKRLRPEDIPCIPDTHREYQKRYRQSNSNRPEARPSLCLFLNYFDRTRSTPSHPITHAMASTVPIPEMVIPPKTSISPEDTKRSMQPSSCFGIMDGGDPFRPSWNDIVNQAVPDDEDSDCFSMSSMDATFEMHHYSDDVVVPGGSHHPTLLFPVFRCNGTKVNHNCNSNGREKRSAPMLPPLVENDSPGGYSMNNSMNNL